MTLLRLLTQILGRNKAQWTTEAEIAPNERIYAVGDIHGRADLLIKLHEMISADAESHGSGKTKKIIYLGDYIDRGPDSKTVIDILNSRTLEGFDPVFLKGNHEDMLLHCLADPAMWQSWLSVGGNATAVSYGATESGDGPESMRQDLMRRIPQAHLDFLDRLALSYRSGDYLFVHAGIRPNVPLDQQDPRDLIWIRREFLNHKEPMDVVVVHGHSISLQPEFLRQRIGIDTGAYATNALSCVVLDGMNRDLISTAPIKLR